MNCILFELSIITSSLTNKIKSENTSGDGIGLNKNPSQIKIKAAKLSIIVETCNINFKADSTIIRAILKSSPILGMIFEIRQFISNYRKKLQATVIKTEITIIEMGEPKL